MRKWMISGLLAVVVLAMMVPVSSFAAEEPRNIEVSPSADSYVNLSGLQISNSRGRAYYGDYIYVAQRDQGISRVNLYSGEVQTVAEANRSFMGIALNTSGDLFYTIDSDKNIYKLDHQYLNQLPLSESQLAANSTVFYSGNYNYIYGLAIDAQNNLYFSDYSTHAILKIPAGATTPITVIDQFSTDFESFTIDPMGNLYASGGGKIYRISANDLGQLPINAESMVNIVGDDYVDGIGMVFLPDGTAYLGGESFSKTPELTLKPIIKLNGQADMRLTVGEAYIEPGAQVLHPNYSDLQAVVTYTLNGASVPGIDSAMPNTYVVHYNAMTPNGYTAEEVTRTVTVREAPTDLADTELGRPFGLAYYNGYVYYADYDRGIFKVSTSTYKVTQVTEDDDVIAVALNSAGDLFYSYSDEPEIYRLDHVHVQDSENLPYTYEQAEELSTLYKQFVDPDMSPDRWVSVNGLAVDGKDRLYAAVQTDDESAETTESEIVRLTGSGDPTSEQVSYYPRSVRGITVGPSGNLYVNVDGAWFEAKASLLEQLPVAADQYTPRGEMELGFGIVFLPNGTGYASSVEPGFLTKLDFKDEGVSPPVTPPQNPDPGSGNVFVPAAPTPNTTPPITSILDNKGTASIANVANIVRLPQPNNQVNLQIALDANKIRQAVNQLQNSNQRSIILTLPKSSDDIASTEISLPIAAAGDLNRAGVGVQILADDVHFSIPASSLSNIGQDLKFTIAPLKTIEERNTVLARAKQLDIVKNLAGAREVSMVGRPIEIETNLQGRPVELTLPILNSLIPQSKDAQADWLNRLQVLAEHDNGETELIRPSVVADANGQTGLSFTVNKFSTFTVLEFAAVSAPVPSKPAYIQGYPDGTFRPDGNVTRAELAALLYRLDAASTGSASAAAAPSRDVPNGFWAQEAISAVRSAGLMKGQPDGTFVPSGFVTRAELAAVISRWQGLDGAGGSAAQDTVGSWAERDIARVMSAGLMQGTSASVFQPERELTRAEAVVILNRILEKSANMASSDKMWPDVPPTYWAHSEIMKATSPYTLK